MIRVRYTGPESRLQGETALAVMSPDPAALQVRFDNADLAKAFGWHDQPAHFFQVVPELLEGAAA